MKKVIVRGAILVLIAVLGIALHVGYVSTLAPIEKYPDEQFAYEGKPKRAMVITAHDDDAISAAGTLSLLAKQGWEITHVCFYSSYGKDSPALRKQEMEGAAKIQGLHKVVPLFWNLRVAPPVGESGYMPVAYAKFDSVFHVAALDSMLTQLVLDVQPTLVFTLDDVIGGYGHPEHVLVSQSARRVSARCNATGKTNVQAIYQAVFSPTQAEAVNKHLPVYIAAKKIYKCAGMPAPTVQVNIQSVAQTKQQAMLAYSSQHRNLKKFWPYYNWYPASLYFSIFACEYFRVMPVTSTYQSTR